MRLGRLFVTIAEKEQIEFVEGGIQVEKGENTEAKFIPADVVIKNFGYNGDAPARMFERITGEAGFTSPIWLSRNGAVAAMLPAAFNLLARKPPSPEEAEDGTIAFGTPGVNNIVTIDVETFLHFARCPKEEFDAFVQAHPRLYTRWEDAGFGARGRGLHASMKWSADVNQRVQRARVEYNRRISHRYSPLQFLEANLVEWQGYCERLSTDANPQAVPFPWMPLLERLRSEADMADTKGPEQSVIAHLLACAHPPEEGGMGVDEAARANARPVARPPIQPDPLSPVALAARGVRSRL